MSLCASDVANWLVVWRYPNIPNNYTVIELLNTLTGSLI